MANIHQLPSGSFRAVIRRKGFPRQAQTFKTRDEAEKWASQIEASVLTKRATNEIANAGLLTFSDAASMYFASAVFLNKAESTRRREKSVSTHPLRTLGDYALVHIDEAVIQSKHIDKRLTEKTRVGKAPQGDTIRLEKAFISAVFNFARKRALVKRNPVLHADFDMPACNRREERITPEQEIMLYSAAVEYLAHHRTNPCLPAWLYFVFATGTRPGEASRIRLEWINEHQQIIALPRASHKTRRPRIILLPDPVYNALQAQIEAAREAKSPFLFFSRTHKTRECVPYAYSHPWKNICARAGLPSKIVPHQMRHEFISRIIETTTLSDSQVAALVGDVHVLSLEPYKHLRAAQLAPHLTDYHETVAQMIKLAHNRLDNKNASVVEPVDTSDLKSLAEQRAGSTPARGTSSNKE